MTHHLTQQLQALGHRMTPQRAVLLRIIEQAECHLSAGEIFQQARAAMPEITEPTIYRTLAFLASQGLVLVAHIGNGQLVYEAAGHNHHHMICRACHASTEIDHTVIEPLFQHLQDTTGYCVDTLHVTFFGLCPYCQQAATVTS